MEKLKVQYMGDLRVEATHERSGAKIFTDAPVDNHGKGESFSPTDLVCTAAAACMMTIMGVSAQTHGFDVKGVEVSITKEMNSNPRRIKRITFDIDLRGREYSAKERKIIEASANACPVMQSLHPDVEKKLNFIYE